ncbi:putative bifunctional diguanylate cyclase/phosphodiesterase [Zavarzinia sp. CC-PAN008]|uniref:putative bifunctional diguanylate cyclase/phosphodiesterase n=1 Tax=Zavarzinia sp. CC-PAN008 TaxID=3243332 RepID=UPI003F744C3F
MSRGLGLLRWLWLTGAEDDVVVAQFAELKRQVPLLYALLVVNAAAVAFNMWGLAPVSLTLGAPGLLLAISIWRLAVWVKRRHERLSAAAAARQLRLTTVLAGVLAVGYIAWALTINAYGGPQERGHVALFIAITVIGCIFCLMHLPQAALLVTVSVTLPYLGYYLSADSTVFAAIAMNILLVTGVMLQILFNNFGAFRKLVRSQAELAAKQAETERLSDENARLAQTDSLTALPNRRYFFARLEAEIRASGPADRRFAVGLLDLDRFKPVNDTYGHVFGDRILAEVGRRLRRIAHEGLVVARLGGDEFGLLLLDGVAEVEAIGQRVCDLLSEPFQFEDVRVSIGCSCGLAVFPDAGTEAHALFDRSDYALYHAKLNNRGRPTLFSLQHETCIRAERATETALHAADLEQEMDIHFQPILDTDTGETVAVEALARWTSPVLGPVRPDQFIAVAERSGMIHGLTLVLLRKALRHLERMPASLALSFNLSAHDITASETVAAIAECVRRSGVDPTRLILELTETAVMRDYDAAAQSMRLLADLGCKVALDDFGTGYSSLGYLHRLPLQKLKIDRSFVRDLDHPSSRTIVTAIVGLCRTLDLECIVEGVEDEGQWRELRALGCRMGQGYLFSRPMPADAMVEWLAQQSLPEVAQA